MLLLLLPLFDSAAVMPSAAPAAATRNKMVLTIQTARGHDRGDNHRRPAAAWLEGSRMASGYTAFIPFSANSN